MNSKSGIAALVDRVRNELCVSRKPKLSDFFDEQHNLYNGSVENEAFLENAEKLLLIDNLDGSNELALEEVYDYMSQDAFNYFFPKILLCYLSSKLNFDGNFASKFWDTIPLQNESDDFQYGKYGRAAKISKFKNFSQSLSTERSKLLARVINELEILSEQD